RAGADRDPSGHVPPQPLDRLVGFVEHLERAPGVLEEHRAGLGRRGAPAAPDQEGHADHALEMTDAVADRRLAQMQGLARARVASRARDGLERPNVRRIDVHAQGLREPSISNHIHSYNSFYESHRLRQTRRMSDVTLRTAGPADAGAIAAIYNQGIEDRLAT